MYKLSFFVPPSHSEQVKRAVFLTGAGRIGDYEQCSWETMGTGQFMPRSGSQPFFGSLDKLEKVQELKVELVCEDALIKKAIEALKEAHPYEEPAYDVWRLEEL